MKFQLSPADLIQSPLKLKMIRFLLRHDALMSEREIASILKISHMSVNRILRELAQENLVHYVTAGKAHLWKVNRKSYLYQILEKLVNNIEQLPDPLRELKQMILKHLPKNLVERAVLFGSVTRGTEEVNSDIDVFILLKNREGQKKIEGVVEKLSNECLEFFGNRFAPYILTREQFKQNKNPDLFDEINKGIQIYPPKT